jgi:hypothetical protein
MTSKLSIAGSLKVNARQGRRAQNGRYAMVLSAVNLEANQSSSPLAGIPLAGIALAGLEVPGCGFKQLTATLPRLESVAIDTSPK